LKLDRNICKHINVVAPDIQRHGGCGEIYVTGGHVKCLDCGKYWSSRDHIYLGKGPNNFPYGYKPIGDSKWRRTMPKVESK